MLSLNGFDPTLFALFEALAVSCGPHSDALDVGAVSQKALELSDAQKKDLMTARRYCLSSMGGLLHERQELTLHMQVQSFPPSHHNTARLASNAWGILQAAEPSSSCGLKATGLA